jgi:hypothetical protein
MALQGADAMDQANVSGSSDSRDSNVTNKAAAATTKGGTGLNPSSYNFSPQSGAFAAGPAIALKGDQLLQAVKNQIEFYLSAANLERDVYLCSLMDANRFVALKKIMEFKKLRSLTTDEAIIIQAMSTSATCSLNQDRTAVRANGKQEAKRNTIVLREISSETAPEAVGGIFSGCDGCGEVLSVRSDVGDIWFVTMKNEEEARKTLLALLGQEFEGKPIKARLKSETVYKSYFNVNTSLVDIPVDATSPLAQNGYMMHNIPPLGYYPGNPQMPYSNMAPVATGGTSPNRYQGGKRGNNRNNVYSAQGGMGQNNRLSPNANAQTQTQLNSNNANYVPGAYKAGGYKAQRGVQPQSTFAQSSTQTQTQTHIYQVGLCLDSLCRPRHIRPLLLPLSPSCLCSPTLFVAFFSLTPAALIRLFTLTLCSLCSQSHPLSRSFALTSKAGGRRRREAQRRR